MKAGIIILGVLLIGLLSGCSQEQGPQKPECLDGPADHSPLIISTTTPQRTYVPGEALFFSTTAENPTDDPITLTFPSSCQSDYSIDGYSAPLWCFTFITEATIPAHSSFEWTHRHSWEERPLESGWHQVVGSVLGVGASCPFPFRIVPIVLPTTSFVLDFESPAGAEDRTILIEEYWPYGVRFRSETDGTRGSRPYVQNRDGNGYLTIGTTSYPPGFNIIACFEMRVLSASVDLSSAVGYTITMIAKDANGNTVATTTSDPVDSDRGFQTLSVKSRTGIASLEWWPSRQQATVLLDNLAIGL